MSPANFVNSAILPTDLAHLHAAVLALPIVQCRFGNAVIAGNCLGINAAFKFLNGLHHLTLCVYFSFHRRKSNDFCLIQICPTNWEGYKKGKLTVSRKYSRSPGSIKLKYLSQTGSMRRSMKRSRRTASE